MNDRIYRGEDDQWYYRTRGQHSVGPFESPTAAEQALNKRLRRWVGSPSPKQAWRRTLHPMRIFRRSATRHS